VPKSNTRGFTLIELIVTLIVAGTLMSIALPSFKNFFMDAKAGSQARALLGDLQYARSEAARLNKNVVVCPSADQASCSTNWNNSRLIFVDENKDGLRSASELILRMSDALASNQAMIGSVSYVRFQSSGQGLVSTFKLCDDRNGNFGREIKVEAGGRSDVAMTTCP
jgi:type IV fimbrial biogenesis protein FimT